MATGSLPVDAVFMAKNRPLSALADLPGNHRPMLFTIMILERSLSAKSARECDGLRIEFSDPPGFIH